MQKSHVKRVHRIFTDLLPVAGRMDQVGLHLVVWHHHGVHHGECRFDGGGAHVGEDDTLELHHWVGALAIFVTMGALRWLPRGFQDGAVIAEQPAVVAAPDAVFGNDAKLERCTTMGAMLVHQTQLPRQVTVEHQVFTQHPHHLRAMV